VWQPSQRYPDPAIEVLDASFARYRLASAAVERLATGFRWCEGPVWFGDGRYLLWSDIPNDHILRWDEETGAVGVFRKPSNYANGNTRDRQVLTDMPGDGAARKHQRTRLPASHAAPRKALVREDSSSSRQATPIVS
jgi:sugar lactone lactonase YvrE